MRRVLRDNGLSITVFALFLVSFVLHALPSSVGGQLAVRGRSPWTSWHRNARRPVLGLQRPASVRCCGHRRSLAGPERLDIATVCSTATVTALARASPGRPR